MSPSRRRFLSYLAASPLAFAENPGVIASPKDAINVMDFEPAARLALPPAHFGYLATGVDDDATLHANRDAFSRIRIRARRMVDNSKTDLRTELFGAPWDCPIALAPVGNQKAFHAEGDLAMARAARARNMLPIVSTFANATIAEVSGILGRPAWFQLYTTNRPAVAEQLVRQAEAARCPVLVVTVDSSAGRHTETLERARRLDTRTCAGCHGTRREDFYRRKPMFKGIDVTGLATGSPAITWEHVRRLKQTTSMKLVLKGIVTREDAELCVENGVDGIIVSNHGGRAEESGRATIECLPEVVEGAAGRIPVLVDGGIRRGTDVFKALALGARAVCIGRPYLWGLAAFGQPGVERVIELLRAELELIMKQCGVSTVAEIKRSHVVM